MKKTLVFLALLFLAATGARAQLQTCTITATVYDWQGQPADSVEVRVVKVLNQAGKLIVARPYSYQTDTNGQAVIIVPRSTATDTVTAYIFIDVWNSAFAARGRLGIGVAVPNAATANLENLAPDDAIPLTHVVAVPTLQLRDSTGARTVTSDTIHIGAGLLLVNSPAGSNDYTLISTAGAAIDTTGYFARYGGVMTESDPVALPIATAAQDSSRLANQRADLLEAEIDTVQDAAIAELESDVGGKQAALSPEQIARIDSMLAAGDFITITSQGGIRIISVDTTGWFARYGGVTTEADPLSIAKDTASLAVYGDQIYPRTAGTPVDTSKFVSMDRDDVIKGEKTFSGIPRFDNTVNFGADIVRLWLPASTFRLECWSAGADMLIGTQGTGKNIGFMVAGTVIASQQAAGLRLGSSVAARKRLDVEGGIIGTDTLRIGDYTTYSYFIPGGALVSSSTQEIKRNISDVPTPTGLFSKFLAVNPKRYQFKPAAFRSVTFASTPDTLTDTDRWALVADDSTKAEQLAKRWQVGLLAEEFNDMLGRTGTEIDYAEVSAVLWKVLQETLRAGNQLRTEVDTLKAQVQTLQTAGANLNARLKALEDAHK